MLFSKNVKIGKEYRSLIEDERKQDYECVFSKCCLNLTRPVAPQTTVYLLRFKK